MIDRLTSRRELLLGAAGLALVAACGGDDDDAAPATISGTSSETAGTGSSGAGNEEGFALLPIVAPSGALAAGVPNRVPFTIGDSTGAFRADVPETLDVELWGPTSDNQVLTTTLPALGEGLPRRYYALAVTLDEGVYQVRSSVDGTPLDFNFQIQAAAEIPLVQPGDPLPSVVTPTTDDDQGVTPICTRLPDACSFHDQTLEAALTTGQPTALLISTPQFCQTAVCGPVLDILLGLAEEFPGLQYVHAEVFENPGEGVSAGAATTDAVNAFGLSFEPSFYVADGSGALVERLDFIFAEEEMRAALERVA